MDIISTVRLIRLACIIQPHQLVLRRHPPVTRNAAVTGSKTLLTVHRRLRGAAARGCPWRPPRAGASPITTVQAFSGRGGQFAGARGSPAAELERAILDHMANRLFTAERVREILKGIYAELRKTGAGPRLSAEKPPVGSSTSSRRRPDEAIRGDRGRGCESGLT